jgi:hypothetical protein
VKNLVSARFGDVPSHGARRPLAEHDIGEGPPERSPGFRGEHRRRGGQPLLFRAPLSELAGRFELGEGAIRVTAFLRMAFACAALRAESNFRAP